MALANAISDVTKTAASSIYKLGSDAIQWLGRTVQVLTSSSAGQKIGQIAHGIFSKAGTIAQSLKNLPREGKIVALGTTLVAGAVFLAAYVCRAKKPSECAASQPTVATATTATSETEETPAPETK